MGIFENFKGKGVVQTNYADPYINGEPKAEEVARASLQSKKAERHAGTINAVTANLMVTDTDYTIVDVNASALKLLRELEPDLRKALPHFSIDTLVGTNIDVFHKNPAHQRGLLDNLTTTYTGRIPVGERTIDLVTSPVFNEDRKRIGTVLEWVDVTLKLAQAERDADAAGQLAAIDKSMATIEFNLDGTIIGANNNFLNTLGYTLDEIKGRHHSMFVTESYRTSAEYREFWAKLNRGEFDSGEYLRIGKGGKEIWIQASYNPIFNAKGEAYKVMKFASDITEQKKLQQMVENVMKDTSRVMNSLSEGKLTDKMDGVYTGEFVHLADAINTYIERLIDMVMEIKEAAVNVKNGAHEIASGNTNLSQRTEEQAASLEETSSAMEEITTTVQQNAANAMQANTLARGARETAENGGNVVGNAVAAMQAISESSNKINDIIGVIDEIAFQTNLLALNAAVEAARAGDQGRGFAVVADEVRSLAGRSATAAKEIKELIKDSGEKVQEGSLLVNKSGETLEEIVTAVKKVNDIVAEISTASEEQATGLDEINRAVGEMDEMTQQNAALVEEAAAASESLGSQAEALDQLIAFFQTGEESHRPAPKRAPAAAAPRRPAAPAKASKPAASAPAEDDKNWEEF